jgi:hypothetical protein
MTDIQVAAGLEKAKKQSDAISYDAAVTEGKELVKEIKSNQMRLGELADRLQPKYGDKTLERFAKAIGIKAATVERWRSTYRKQKGKPATEPVSPSVLKALQGLPQPVQDKILKEKPNLTVREAHTHARDYRAAHPAQGEFTPESLVPQQDQTSASAEQEDWRLRDARPWFAKAHQHAAEATNYSYVNEDYLEPTVLRAAIENLDQFLAALRAGGAALIGLADKVERKLAPPPPPMWSDVAPGTSSNTTPDEGAPAEGTPEETSSAEAASD